MKNLKKLALIALSVITLNSCSKDDAPTPLAEIPPTLIDNWNIKKIGEINDLNEVTREDDWEHDCTIKKDYFILTTSDIFKFNYYTNACESTFFYQEVGNYSYNSSTKRLIVSGGTDWDGSYDVLSLTQTELKLKKIIIRKVHQNIIQRLPITNYFVFSRKN